MVFSILTFSYLKDGLNNFIFQFFIFISLHPWGVLL